MKTTRLAAIALGVGMGVAARGQGVIDTFQTWQFVDVGCTQGATCCSSTLAPEALGGERDLGVCRVGGLMDSLCGDTGLTLGDSVSLSCGPGVSGAIHIVYDGIDGSHDINYTGLGGIDLTEGGVYDAFTFASTSDLGAIVTLTVYQDATRYSTTTLPVVADPSFTFVDQVAPFADFIAAGPDGGADFTQVGAIELVIGKGPPGADISLRTFGLIGPPPPPKDGGDFCQKTQGYWKTHGEAWPVDSLLLGGETYTKWQLLWLLWWPTRGDASMILAHQLIAAKLNLAAGSDPTSIAGAVAEADALLAQFAGLLPYVVPGDSPLRQQMIDAAAMLDAYNNSCEEEDDGGGPPCPSHGAHHGDGPGAGSCFR